VKTFDADQDYDDFEAWFHELDETKFSDFAYTWMDSMQAGYTLPRSGYDTFKGWLFDRRWPEVRMQREMQELMDRADAARWAA
jgi:hypothetical protein